MSQQINLINPSLIKQKDLLTPINIGLAYGVFSLLMFVWFAVASSQLSSLTTKHDIAASQLMELQDNLTLITEANVQANPDKGLQIQLAALEKKKQAQAGILSVIGQGKRQETSLANYMQGLARQTMGGLWLTGFSIDQEANNITLRGRSLTADILPEYMKKLGGDPEFVGQLFGGLQVTLPEQVVKVGTDTADPVTTVPQYVEFELQGLEISPNELATNEIQTRVKS